MSAEAIDWEVYEGARAALGAEFARRLGFFAEDGAAWVSLIEQAMRRRDAAALVIPAGRLGEEADAFGATALADAADQVEAMARRSVESREAPDEALPVVAGLRALFEATIAELDEASTPLLRKRAG